MTDPAPMAERLDLRQHVRRYWPHAVVSIVALSAVLFPGVAIGRIQLIAQRFLIHFDWLTLLVTTGAVIFCVLMTILPVGKYRLGGNDARPEFKTSTWIAMLFAAGMGAGLVFWAVAEPLIHYINPPPGGPAGETVAARNTGLGITQFHWSIHAWSIYAVAALAIAIFTSTKRSTPLPSAPLPPAASRPVKRLVDWLALVAVLFGIVASLGQGALQMGAGIERLSGEAIPDTTLSRVVILTLLTVSFLISAAAGLRRGIAVLSNINMVLAGVLAVFVFVAGPTSAILQAMWDSIVAYGRDFIYLSTNLRAEGAARTWERDWSLTYFLWWIAWTPFVGVFIARISYGRTIRAFMAGVVLIPSFVTLVWFSIFGGTGLALHDAGIDLGVRDFATAPAATYAMLAELPFGWITQALALCLVFIFLLTSADSGAYVLAIFSRGESLDPPVGERLFWGLVLAFLTAAAILSAQGQSATRAMAVAGAVPLVLLLAVQALMVITRREWRRSVGRSSAREAISHS